MRFLLVAVAVLGGCTMPKLPIQRIQFDPPQVYYDLWQKNLVCESQATGQTYTDKMDDLVQQWWMWPGHDVGEPAAAYTSNHDGITEIDIAEDYFRYEPVVRHEMIHAMQTKHPELIGPNNNWHAGPVWSACGVPIAVENRVPVIPDTAALMIFPVRQIGASYIREPHSVLARDNP
jgi:hypothetical protein